MAALAAATTSVAAVAGARNASPSEASRSVRPCVSGGLSCCTRAALLPCLSLRLGGGRLSSRVVRRLRPFLVAQRAAQAEAKQDEEEDETESESDEVPESASSAEATVSGATLIDTILKELKEALAAEDEDAVANLEGQLRLLEQERESLFQQVASLTEDISLANQRFLRLNADFDNYRKRSEREKVSLSDSAKGDVIETLLPMIDNFERAKGAIKTETDAEQKIDNSYQSIYKQFVEVMRSLGVSVVETVGKEFNPEVHEAIMREDSSEYPDGIITQEFRRGFRIGSKLLRPAMVKVSAGPGPSNATPPPAPAAASASAPEAEPAEEEVGS